MPLGIGAGAIGTAAAGYGVPDTTTVVVGAILPDPATGLPQTGRFIDPIKKSYVLTANGQVQGAGTAKQLVGLAVGTDLGTAVITTLGQALFTIQEKGSSFAQQVTAAFTDAFADIVSQGVATLDSVQVFRTPNPDGAVALVLWTDRTTGVQARTLVGP